MITQQSQFLSIHEKLAPIPTRKQSQVIAQIALSQIQKYDNEIQNEQISLEIATNKHNQQQKSRPAFFQHYTYGHRLRYLKQQIREIYENTFKNTMLQHFNATIGYRNNSKLQHELVKRKRPPDTMRRS